MLPLIRPLVIITPLLIFSGFTVLFWRPTWIYWLTIFFIVLILLTIWQITARSWQSKKFQNFLLPSLLFIIGTLLFVVFLSQGIFRWLIVVLACVWLGFYLENLFTYFHRPRYYQVNSLNNLSNYLNLVTIFFIISACYSFIVFLGINYWVFFLPVWLLISLLIQQSFWINKFSLSDNRWLILISGLLIAELFLVLSWLPTGFYVNSLILTTVYYLMLGLSKLHLSANVTKRNVGRYLIVATIVLALVLGTARWI